ncbi:MAG: LysR substrate-binding domain-containing protein [Archangium sp.]
MAKDQSAQLSDFEWQLLSRCLRPDQRHRAASRWHPLYAVVQHSWSLPLSEVTNDSQLTVSLVEQGLGLAYVLEPMVAEQLRTGRLQRVLESYAPTVPGFFLYYPSRAQLSPALRLFVDAARELAAHAL